MNGTRMYGVLVRVFLTVVVKSKVLTVGMEDTCRTEEKPVWDNNRQVFLLKAITKEGDGCRLKGQLMK